MAAYPDLKGANPTPGRKVRFVYDVSETTVFEKAFGLVKRHDQMCKGASAFTSKVEHVPGIGWRLARVPQRERSSAQSGIKKSVADGGTLQMPSGMSGAFAFRSPTELTGSTTGASGDLVSQGDRMYQLALAQGATLGDSTTHLSADAAAFPGYDNTDAQASFRFDRRAADATNHDPDEAFRFRFEVTGPQAQQPDEPYRLYFLGPASYYKGDFEGFGQFCIRIFGDGQAFLYQRGNDLRRGGTTWALSAIFRYCPEGLSVGVHSIFVQPHIYKPRRGRKVGSITFDCQTSSQIRGSALQLISGNPQQERFVKEIFSDEPRPTVAAPIRVDQRNESRGKLQLAAPRYETSGYLVDDPFDLLQLPRHVTKLTLQWFGDVPAGCGITVDLLYGDDLDDAVSLPISSGGGPFTVSGLGGYCTFDLDPDVSVYKARVNFSGTGTKTPTLYEARPAKNQHSSTVAPGEHEVYEWLRVHINGPSMEAASETARISLEDLQDRFETLKNRAGAKVEIRTEYPGVDWTNPANAAKRSVLFSGYVASITSRKKGRKMGQGAGKSFTAYTDPFSGASVPAEPLLYPSSSRKAYELELASPWRILDKALAPYWTFYDDPTVERAESDGLVPWKATDALYYLLLWSGASDEQIDFGPGKTVDLPLRLWARDNNDGAYDVQLGSPIGDMVRRIASEYLGATVIFDPNCGVGSDPAAWKGMWRLVMPRKGNYRNLAYFSHTHPGSHPAGSGKVFMPMVLTAWPAVADPTGSGQSMAGAPIVAGSLEEQKIEPEANMITVSSTGQIGAGLLDQFTVTLFNYRSFDFDPSVPTADPTSPDYLTTVRHLIVVDSNLGSSEAVHWAARRYYDFCSHGRKIWKFVAPLLLVTDSSDASQKRPRPLRYYDCVMVDGQQCIVRQVTPFFEKSFKQMAMYEVEVILDPDAIVGSGHHMEMRKRWVGTTVKRMGAVVWDPISSSIAPYEAQRKAAGHRAELLVRPVNPISIKAQVLDSSSADFGKFYFLPGYDAPGSDHPIGP